MEYGTTCECCESRGYFRPAHQSHSPRLMSLKSEKTARLHRCTDRAEWRTMRLELDLQTPEWALPLLEPARYKGAKGGRSSGKSHFFAELAVEEMVADPSLRFVCIREVQRSLKFSAKSLVEKKIRELGVSHLFTVLDNEIRRNGGSGVMIFEGMQSHTADSLKSLEGFGNHLLDRQLREEVRFAG